MIDFNIKIYATKVVKKYPNIESGEDIDLGCVYEESVVDKTYYLTDGFFKYFSEIGLSRDFIFKTIDNCVKNDAEQGEETKFFMFFIMTDENMKLVDMSDSDKRYRDWKENKIKLYETIFICTLEEKQKITWDLILHNSKEKFK